MVLERYELCSRESLTVQFNVRVGQRLERSRSSEGDARSRSRGHEVPLFGYAFLEAMTARSLTIS